MLQRSRHEDDSLITVSVISGRVNRMWVKRHQYPAARRPPRSSVNDKPCQPERNPLADHDDSVFHRRLQRGREISCAAARTDSRSPPTQPRRFLGPRLPGLWTTVIGCGGSELAARSDSRHGQLSRVKLLAVSEVSLAATRRAVATRYRLSGFAFVSLSLFSQVND